MLATSRTRAFEIPVEGEPDWPEWVGPIEADGDGWRLARGFAGPLRAGRGQVVVELSTVMGRPISVVSRETFAAESAEVQPG